MPGRSLLGLLAMAAALLGISLGGCRPKTDGQSGAVGSGRPAILRVKVSPNPPRVGDRLAAEAERHKGFNSPLFTLVHTLYHKVNSFGSKTGLLKRGLF